MSSSPQNARGAARSSRRRERRPDSNLAQTLASVRAQRDFKRMLVFALRSLSDMCAVSNRQSADNSYVCVEQGLLTDLESILAKHTLDAEIVGLTSRVLLGMASAFVSEPDDDLRNLAMEQNITDIVSTLISQALKCLGLNQGSSWEELRLIVENLAKCSIPAYNPELLTDMTTACSAKASALSPAKAHLIAASYKAACASSETKLSLIQTKVPSVLLNATQQLTAARANDKSVWEFATASLATVAAIIAGLDEYSDDQAILSLIGIIENATGRKAFKEQASQLLAKMLGPAQLKAALTSLSSGGDTGVSALSLLTALSYVPAYAEQWAANGGNEPLVNVLKQQAKTLNVKDAKQVDGLVGAASMICQIASDPKMAKELAGMGCLAALLDVIAALDAAQHAALLAPAIQAAARLSEAEPSTMPTLVASPAMKVVTKSLASDSTELMLAAASLCRTLAVASPSSCKSMAQAETDMALHPMLAQLSKHRDQSFANEAAKALTALAAASPLNRQILWIPSIVKACGFLSSDSSETAELLVKLLSKLAESTDPSMQKAFVDEGVANALLELNLKFSSNSVVKTACRKLLATSVADDDLKRAVARLNKAQSSPKSNTSEMVSALAAIHGLCEIDKLSDSLQSSGAMESVIKAVSAIVGASAFPAQGSLLKSALDCLSGLQERSPSNSGALSSKLLSHANSTSVKALLQAQNDADDNSVLDLLNCTKVVITGDAFEDQESAVKVLDAVSNTIRMFPEHRRVQLQCLELITLLLQAKSCHVGEAFSKSGCAKQVLSFLQKATHHEEVQKLGLRALLLACQRDRNNVEALRASGAIEIVKAASRTHQNKAEIQRLHAQLANLLTPEDQARQEVSEQIGNLNTAGKNRDLLTGQSALGALSDLTAAADAAKHASRSGVGDAMSSFFEAMKAPKTSFAELEVCSAGAVGIVKNVAVVGKPHSTLLLKHGALNMLRSIAMEAKDSGSPAAMEVFAAALEGGRALLSHEKNAMYATGASDFAKYMNDVLPSVMDSPELLMPVVASMGLLASTQTVKDPAFIKAIAATVPALTNATTSEERQQTLSCILQMLGTSDLQAAQIMAQIFTDAGGCEAVIKMFDLYSEEDPATAELARQVLSRICIVSGDGEVLRKALMKRGGMAAVTRACKAFGRNLGNCRDDSVASAATLSLLTTFTCRMDRSDLQATGLLEVVEEIMEAHPTSASVRTAVGGLLVNFGAEDHLQKYFRECISLLTTKTPGFEPRLVEVCKKLEIFIPCQSEKTAQAYAEAPQAINLLSDFLPSCRSDPELLPSIVLVAWRLVQRFEAEPDSPFGVNVVLPQMMPQIVSLIHKKDPGSLLRKSRPFLRDSYNILANICEHPEGVKQLRKLVADTNFLTDTWELFERYSKDAEVSSPIIRFLGNFAADQQAVDLIELGRMQCATAKEMGKDSQSAVLKAIKNMRRSPGVVEEGLVAVGAMTKCRKDLAGEPMSKENLKAAQELARSSPEGAAGYARMVSQIAENNVASEAHDLMLEEALDLLVEQWTIIKDDPDVDDEAKEKIMSRMCDTTDCLASRGRYQAIKKQQMPTLIAEAVKSLPAKKGVVGSAIKAFTALGDKNEFRDALLTKCIPVMVGEGSIVLQESPEIALEGMKLIDAILTENPDSASFLKSVNGLRETIDGVTALAEEGELKSELMQVISNIKHALKDSQPTSLTLEEVHRRWSLRKENGELLDLHDNAALAPEFNFVFDTTQEYSKEPLATSSEPMGREFSFGCLCFGLLHDFPDNIYKCTQMGEQDFFMKSLDALKVEELVQYVVNACVPALHVSEGAEAFATVPSAATTVVAMVGRGQKKWCDGDRMRHEAYLIRRLEFMELICHKRTFYNDTDALTVLVELWDAVENTLFSQAVLRSVVRVLRLMINEAWTDGLIMNRVSERLLEKVELRDCPHDLLADVLFCLGTMAGLNRLRNLIGELEGVEKIVDLLKRCEKAQKKSVDVSRTQQNACLALANLVLGHGSNVNNFGNAKGVDLVTRVMTSSMSGRVDYDLANAASVLMCNVSFKRDDFKEALGSRGAPQAIILTIQNYDGLCSERAYRCLASMFKGVTNLALMPANVQRFLDNHLTESLVAFYGNAENIPDSLVLHSLRTLSNLTLENSETFMREFGSLVPALLHLLESKQRSDGDMLAFCFETFTSLCRFSENRDTFIRHRGIEIVMGYLNAIKNEKVYEMGLCLMAVLATEPRAAERMIQSNFYTFALSLLDDCDELSPEIFVAGLKVLRRLVSEKTAAAAFIEASPMPLLSDMMVAAAHLADTDSASAITVVEILRILLHLLHLHPPANGSALDEDALVVTDPEWSRHFDAQNVSSKSKSFGRLFKNSGIRSVTSMAEDETEPNLASPSLEDSTDGSPVALDSPSAADTQYSNSSHSSRTLDDQSGTDGGAEKFTDRSTDKSVLLKPKGPRSYEAIGLDAKRVLSITKALFGMLIDQESESLALDRLTEYAVVLLAYFTSEKVDGVGMAFQDSPHELGQFVCKAFGQMKQMRGPLKTRLVFESTELLGNVLCLISAESIRTLAKEPSVLETLKECAAALHPKRDVTLKRKIEEICALLSYDESELKPSLFYPISTYDFPLDKSEFGEEKYPNGIQDLESAIRKKIRRGGKCYFVEVDEGDDAKLAPCFWRSSADMTTLQYMSDRKMQNYDWQVPLARVRKVERGVGGSATARKFSSKLRLGASTTISIIVSPCNSWPSGHELVLSFSTRFRCSRFYKRLREWQAAATI